MMEALRKEKESLRKLRMLLSEHPADTTDIEKYEAHARLEKLANDYQSEIDKAEHLLVEIGE